MKPTLHKLAEELAGKSQPEVEEAARRIALRDVSLDAVLGAVTEPQAALAVARIYAEAAQRESDLLARLPGLDASAIGEHFGAAQTVFFPELNHSDLDDIQVLRSSSTLVLSDAWRTTAATVWSIPLDGGVLQMAFSEKRTPLAREMRLLRTIARHRSRAHAADLLKLIEVEDLERKRISRELHDDACQALAVIRLQIELADAPERMGDTLDEICGLTEKTIAGIRRLVTELNTGALAQSGLTGAISQVLRRFAQTTDMRVTLDAGELPLLAPGLELVIFRAVQECLANISRHSSAKNVHVSLNPTDKETVRLSVEDDGTGFDVNEASDRRNCFGLRTMRDRVELLGGRFHLESQTVTGSAGTGFVGTKVVLELPFHR